MTHRRAPTALAILAAAGGALLPGAGGAQEAAPPSEIGGGWIGFAYDVRIPGGERYTGEDTPTVVVVSRVVEGSPAERAGLRPGDRILEVNGTPATPGSITRLSRTLEPGENVTLRLRRDGDARSVSLKAGERPRAVPPPLPDDVAAHLDSVREAVLAEFDSVRVRFRRDRGGRIRVTVRGDSTVAFRVGPGGEEVTVFRREDVAPLPDPGIRFESPRPPGVRLGPLPSTGSLADSTHRELRGLQEALVRTKLTENALRTRLRRLRLRGEEVESDALEQLRSLESRADSVERALQSVYRRLAREQREGLRALGERERFEDRLPSAPPRARVAPSAPAPLTPHLVGRDFVAGARLATLNPGLAEYFRIDEGVLVTEVLEGSPAQESGLAAGDVVVAVGGDEVGSLEELRRRLARLQRWPAELQIVRKGERRTVRLGGG